MTGPQRRLVVGFIALLGLLSVAVLGYRYLEGWDPLQAWFFAITTVTTIGYSDYSISDRTKLFTMALVGVGIIVWLYLVNGAIEYAASHWSERLRRREERELNALRDHFIVIGYGAVGQQVVEWLRRAGRRVVVVDSDEQRIAGLHASGIQCLHGDATDEETLKRAGLERAAGLLAVTRADPVNVFVTLTARALRPSIYIAANASSPAVADKLRRAGATTAVSPYALGAQRLAEAALSPHIAELFAGLAGAGNLLLREAELEAASPLCGATLRESGLRQQANVMVVAHKPAGGAMTVNPSADTPLGAGDILIAFGDTDDLNRFVELAAPAASAELRALG